MAAANRAGRDEGRHGPKTKAAARWEFLRTGWTSQCRGIVWPASPSPPDGRGRAGAAHPHENAAGTRAPGGRIFILARACAWDHVAGRPKTKPARGAAFRAAGNQTAVQAFWSQRMEASVDRDSKHEIVVLMLGTLTAIPVVTGIGLAIVTGVLAW